jgi:hypothetical protein
MTEVTNSKYSINLLQPELIPVKPLWSLKRVCMVWVLITLIMVAWVFLSQHQLKKAQQIYTELKNEKIILNNRVSSLEKDIDTHKPDNKLKNEINFLTMVLNNKTRLYKGLTDTTKTQVAGFAKSMTELSENHHKGISLSAIQINNDDLAFTGLTKNPQSVPAWLAGFEGSTFLSGKRFINFVMQENENKEIQFTVSSKGDRKELTNE